MLQDDSKSQVKSMQSLLKTPIYKQRSFLMALALLIAISGLGLLIWQPAKQQYYSNNEKKIQEKLLYSYNEFDEYHLKSEPLGSGIRFSKPIEIKRVSQSWQGKNYLDLVNRIPVEEGTVDVATITVKLVPFDKPPTGKELKDRDFLLTDSKAIGHQEAKKDLFQFINYRHGLIYNIKLDNVKRMVGSNIKTNAWQVEFTGTDKNSKHPRKPIKGKHVFAVGEKGYYYFMIMGPESNWQKSQQDFNRVIASLKLDQ